MDQGGQVQRNLRHHFLFLLFVFFVVDFFSDFLRWSEISRSVFFSPDIFSTDQTAAEIEKNREKKIIFG